eukprot:INCI15442.1.p1 GENE.INCI15442.1~~INCI15442.1.p1  ORF type:complete len:395 (-),score=73.56 INCI15442.1:812-1996(-)
MDVFDLIGGERSDISDWEDSSDEEHDEGSEVSDQAPFADAGPKQQPSSIQEDTRPTKNKNFEDMGHQQAACIAGSACCSSVDASADDEESAAEEALKVDTCSADTDCVQAEAPPPLQSKDGDALNLFTINPVSKEDAKNYAPLLGMHSELEPAGGAFDESAAGDDSSPAALSNAFSPRRAKIPFLDAHPELDVLVLDNVLSERECARIVATAEASHGFSFWDARPEARKDYRDADTIEVFDDDFSVLLWSRIAQFFSDPEAGTAPNPGSSRIRIAPQEDLKDCRWQRDLVGEWVPTGTNNNLLVARYHPHGHFAPHTDGYSIIDFNNRSMYSIVLYLNTIPKGCGGGTRFYSDEQKGKLIFDPEQRRYVAALIRCSTHASLCCGVSCPCSASFC